jgi:haloacetate dehalogenase
MFEDFKLTEIAVSGGGIRLRHRGDGKPLVLLHGNPQSHVMWNRVAPVLAERFHVICPDLRGYGGSFKPAPTADHAPYAKRAMARDVIEVMEDFGYPRFMLAGHDRGARVAHRLTLDYPEAVERLAVLDIIPTLEHFERADMAFAMGYYHWFFFAQPNPVPETLINATPEAWFGFMTGRGGPPAYFAPQALTEYLAAARDPAAIAGMCEDYRAAATIDLVHDRASRDAGEKIACPLLVLWGGRGRLQEWYDVLAIWRSYAHGDVDGGTVDAGHYLAEEAPEAVLDWFERFFG